MTNASQNKPPKVCEFLLTLISPRSIREDLLGDLEERFHQHTHLGHSYAAMKYWLEAMRLLPFIAGAQMQSPAERHTGIRVAAIVMSLLFVVFWEGVVVQNNAWPLTASLLDTAPIAGKSLFLIVYASIYFAGTVLIVLIAAIGLSIVRRKYGCAVESVFFIMGVALSSPLFLNIIEPQKLDSVAMRFILIAGVWICVISALLFSYRSQQ